MKRKLAGIALATGLVAASAFAQNTGLSTAAVEGVVFTVDASGNHAVVPASRVSLDGPTHIEAETDSAGSSSWGVHD